MFGLDWNDPQTLWLNVTNLALGIATLAALGAFTYGLLGDLVTLRKRSRVTENLGDDMRHLVGAGTGAHLMPVHGLGLTMADGGEPVERAEEPKPGTGADSKPRKTE